MKKNNLYILLLLLFIFSCKSPLVTDPIPLERASVLVSDLLRHSTPQLRDITSKYALGGTFPAESFRLHPDSSGIILWFCFKGGSNPEVFLALECLKEYDSTKLPTFPINQNLIRPATPFKDTNGTQHSVGQIRTFLTNHSIRTNTSTPLSNTMALKYVVSFDSLMNEIQAGTGEKYNKYPFSYFEENSRQELKRFVEQAGPNGFVRYYFGYDETDHPNRIRVILVAVTAAGKNITKINGADAIILQKSFPPPPYN